MLRTLRLLARPVVLGLAGCGDSNSPTRATTAMELLDQIKPAEEYRKK